MSVNGAEGAVISFPVGESPLSEGAVCAPEDDRLPDGYATLGDVHKACKETEWLWREHFAIGHVCVIAGDTGWGKSLVTLDLVKRLLEGIGWPDGTPCERLPFVMWLDTEGTQSVLTDRALTLGIQLERIVLPFAQIEALSDVRLDDARDWEKFKTAVMQSKPRLVVIDSLGGAHGKDGDKARDMTDVMGKLQRLARDAKCCIIVVHHVRKKDSRYPAPMTLDDMLGSVAVAANSRIVWGIEPVTPGDSPDGPRRLRMLKSNLCAFPDSLGFDTDECVVMWIALPEDKARKSEADKADEFLKRTFAGKKAALQTDVHKLALADGIKWPTLRRAKARLKIASKKRTKAEGGQWEWVWTQPAGGQDAHA